MNFDRPSKTTKPPVNTTETPTSKGIGALSREQVVVIKLLPKLAREVQEKFPDIALDYASGLRYNQIVQKYDIQNLFSCGAETARQAVMKALTGYKGKHGPHFQGLITDIEVLARIEREHRSSSSAEIGRNLKDTGRGIFGLTDKESISFAKKGGDTLFKSRKGIHQEGYRAPQPSLETRQMAARGAAARNGITVLSTEAGAYIHNIDLNSPEYKTTTGKTDILKITREVNEKFYPGDNKIKAGAMHSFIRRMKKRNTTTP